MESMNVLDITIRYFNVIVFIMCVLFGMISLFASWIAWREIYRKKNIIRSVIAAYNIAEDAMEKGRTPSGEMDLDPAVIQTIFHSLQEILNSIYGEVTGKPIPPREDRGHGSGRLGSGTASLVRMLKRKAPDTDPDLSDAAPPLVAGERDHHQPVSHP